MGPALRHSGPGQRIHDVDGLHQAQQAQNDKKRSAAPVQQNQREPKDSKDGENVPVVKQGVDQAQQEQQNEPPHESFPEIHASLLLPVQLDEEAEAEQEGKEKERLADEKMFVEPVRGSVGPPPAIPQRGEREGTGEGRARAR